MGYFQPNHIHQLSLWALNQTATITERKNQVLHKFVWAPDSLRWQKKSYCTIKEKTWPSLMWKGKIYDIHSHSLQKMSVFKLGGIIQASSLFEEFLLELMDRGARKQKDVWKMPRVNERTTKWIWLGFNSSAKPSPPLPPSYGAHMPMRASRKKSRQCFCQSSWASLRATRAPGMSYYASCVCVCVLKRPLYINHHNTLKTEQHAWG